MAAVFEAISEPGVLPPSGVPAGPCPKPGDTCKRGHALDYDTVGWHRIGGRAWRYCRICRRITNKRRRSRRDR